MRSTLFNGLFRHTTSEAARVEIPLFVPVEADRYFVGSPTTLRPSEIVSADTTSLYDYVGTVEERAVIATFVRICADIDNYWYGISLRALIERLHNEADRVEAGQTAIREAAVNYCILFGGKRGKRFAAYRRGVDACIKRGLLRCEKLGGVDVISAHPSLIEALRVPAEKVIV